MFKCDLHIHSICSDGRFTPSDIVKMAKKKKLRLCFINRSRYINWYKRSFI